MTIKKKSRIFKTLCMALFFGSVSNLALAESAYEQKYSQWKAEQTQQDQRLKSKVDARIEQIRIPIIIYQDQVHLHQAHLKVVVQILALKLD